MIFKKWLETHDTTSTAKIRHLVEPMDEEEISFHEQTSLEGIESAKRNYNDATLRQNVLREIELKKPALMVYTDGRFNNGRRKRRREEGRYKIEKDVPISSAELKAIEIATNFIFQQDEQNGVILTDSRTACQILMQAMEGDRHN
jgi:hypothetical protein